MLLLDIGDDSAGNGIMTLVSKSTNLNSDAGTQMIEEEN